jgi:FdhD protein
MCTPADLESLAVGFLFNEEIIRGLGEIAAVSACENGSNIDVWLDRPVQKPAQWRRTSGCTGGVTSTAILRTKLILSEDDRLTPDMVLNAMEELLKAQD